MAEGGQDPGGTVSLIDVLPDPPEVVIEKLCDLFPILNSKTLFLESKSQVINEDTEGAKTDAKLQLLEYLSSCGTYVLQRYMMSQIVSSQRLLDYTILPLSANPSSTMQSAHRNILERLEVNFQLSLNISENLKAKAAVESKIKQVETEIFAAREKLNNQLVLHGQEKQQLESKRPQLSVEKTIASRVKKINLMRTLMHLLISNSKRNLLEEPELASKLIKYSAPLTIREIKEMP